VSSEVSREGLLTKTLQRLLYHTGFSAGLVLSRLAGAAAPPESGLAEVRIEAVVGNYHLSHSVGEIVTVPAALVEGTSILAEKPDALSVFAARKPYRCFLRLPIPNCGTMLLLSAEAPDSTLPWADVFVPIVSHLATALSLCESVRERTAALEQANVELEAFACSVSHDLRTPLRAINGYARLLLDEHAQTLPEDARRRLNQISANARHMGDLIDGILRFSRAVRRPITATTVDMTELARAVVADLMRTCAERSVRFDIGELPSAYGDSELLRQVLANLVSNAIKFSASRREALIELGGSKTKDGAEYYVKDNGVGFDMAYVHKLFGVFERLHAPSEYEGTGIGLAITKRVIVRHGGRIWAEGNEGVGAVFRFFLPRA
jgi:signal transduction histidine kinase